VREAWLKLEDFADSEAYGVDNFMLMIVRKTIYNKEQWHGFFQGDKKQLKLLAKSTAKL